jgi:uncharacterized protein (DUF2267 family)
MLIMPEKTKVLRLSDILQQFETSSSTDGTTKTAASAGKDSESNVVTPDQVAAILGEAQGDPSAQGGQDIDPETLAALQQQQAGAGGGKGQQQALLAAANAQAEQEDAAKQAITEAAKGVVQAETTYNMAVESLKQLAKQAQEKELTALEKDAQVFGKLFADGFFDTLQEKQAHTEITKEAYDMTKSYLNTIKDVMIKEAYEAGVEEAQNIKGIDEDDYTNISKEAYDITRVSLNALEKEASGSLSDDAESEMVAISRNAYSVVKQFLGK